jgi:hypothetical protein
MPKVFALQYDHLVDRRPPQPVTFDQVRVKNAKGNFVFLGVAEVTAALAKEFYDGRPEQFRVEWGPEEQSAAAPEIPVEVAGAIEPHDDPASKSRRGRSAKE